MMRSFVSRSMINSYCDSSLASTEIEWAIRRDEASRISNVHIYLRKIHEHGILNMHDRSM